MSYRRSDRLRSRADRPPAHCGPHDAEIVDALHGAGLVHWANRLMLLLGEPEIPTRKKDLP